MNNLKMFCLSMQPEHLSFIKEIGYLPTGLGNEKFSKEWYVDDLGKNISKKNKYYGEYTFHYWLWKNHMDKLNFKDNWIGFCQYRKFWSSESNLLNPTTLNQLKSLVLKKIPESYENADVILGDEIVTTNFKKMKFLKKGIQLFLKNPSYLFNKNKRNIKFHFDLMHGYKNLDRAMDLLDVEDKNDFKEFVSTQTSFNPHNMFICKSKNTLIKYYSVVFPWLERCEKLFGFENLKEFGKIRIYTFLAERFMSYWFQKNTKSKTMPILFYDIRKDIQ